MWVCVNVDRRRLGRELPAFSLSFFFGTLTHFWAIRLRARLRAVWGSRCRCVGADGTLWALSFSPSRQNLNVEKEVENCCESQKLSFRFPVRILVRVSDQRMKRDVQNRCGMSFGSPPKSVFPLKSSFNAFTVSNQCKFRGAQKEVHDTFMEICGYFR